MKLPRREVFNRDQGTELQVAEEEVLGELDTFEAPGRSGNTGRARSFVRMPRFFFDTNGDRIIPDEEGCDLAEIEEAKAEAVKALPDIARDVSPMEITASSWSRCVTKLAIGS